MPSLENCDSLRFLFTLIYIYINRLLAIILPLLAASSIIIIVLLLLLIQIVMLVEPIDIVERKREKFNFQTEEIVPVICVHKVQPSDGSQAAICNP